MVERTQTYPKHKWAWYDFVLEVNSVRTVRCSECGAKILAGESAYVHRRGNHVMKRVCSEECGQNFDYWMMREAARERAERERLGR